MSHPLSRRNLLQAATGAGVVFGLPRLVHLTNADGQQPPAAGRNSGKPAPASASIDRSYLEKGLSALARAHRVNSMTGHLGAAVVAGYLIAEQHPQLDDAVFDGIERDLDRVVAGQSVFSPKGNAALSVSDLFRSFPRERSQANLVDGIAETLAENIDGTRQSGHNVIFAALAIRALKDHPEFATPAITHGVCKLIEGFRGATPGSGYYGKSKGRISGRKVELKTDDRFPRYIKLENMTEAVLGALIEHGGERRIGFGGLTHIINHGAALAELAHYGYRDLALKGLAGHHQHLQLWRTLPDVTDEPDQVSPSRTKHDPQTSEFWQATTRGKANAKLTHRIKTIYGFDALTDSLDDDPSVQKARFNLRYLL